jgi:hypothetical protein
MATFDQLPAEQRAIIELVVARGRSYDALADVLQVPSQRVRELAREALVELSPVTGARVEEKWRGQVADYLLGQQEGAEARATVNHLKRSEPARSWALSLLDALDSLYGDNQAPSVPEAEAPAAEEREERRPRERERERPRRERAAAATKDTETRVREKRREAEKEKREEEVEEEEERKPIAGRSVLSPAAQSALRRRRIFGALAGLVVVVALGLGVAALAGAFSSDDGGGGESDSADSTTETTDTTGTTPEGQPEVLGQIPLEAVGDADAQGVAYLLRQGDQQVLAVTAQLPPLPASQRKAAYNVWLYNDTDDAASIGAQFTNGEGAYQGVGPLPEDFDKYKYIDVSRQPFNKQTGHSGDSVLRGELANLEPVPEGQQGAPAPGGTPPTPEP